MPPSPSPSPFHLLLPRLLLSATVAAAQPSAAITTPTADGTFSFRPGIAVVVGIFAVMFSLTFLLLVYAKFCRSAAVELFGSESPADAGGLLQLPSGHLLAGLDKAGIESLPFFRFAALRGARGGLECAVCLAPFADADVLRLLPKCKHAFHVPCVDRWLESRATCPLCRQLVDADDAALFKNSTSARFMLGSGRLDDDIELELFVEREGEGGGGGGGDCNGTRGSSSRFSIGSSFRKMGKNSREESANGGQGQLLHKFKHRIIVSDVVFKRRWSDLNSSDLLSLSADMLNVVSSKRFTEVDSIAIGGDQSLEDKKVANDDRILKIKEEMEKKRVLENKARQIHQSKSEVVSSTCSCSGTNIPRALISPGERSMSEITNLSRFRPVRDGGNGANDEKLRRIWLPIARRTVQWFAGRERRSSQNQIRGTEEPTWV